MSILGSYVFGSYIQVTDGFMEETYTLTTWLLTAAMVGLGLNVFTKAMHPLIVHQHS